MMSDSGVREIVWKVVKRMKFSSGLEVCVQKAEYPYIGMWRAAAFFPVGKLFLEVERTAYSKKKAMGKLRTGIAEAKNPKVKEVRNMMEPDHIATFNHSMMKFQTEMLLGAKAVDRIIHGTTIV